MAPHWWEAPVLLLAIGLLMLCVRGKTDGEWALSLFLIGVSVFALVYGP